MGRFGRTNTGPPLPNSSLQPKDWRNVRSWGSDHSRTCPKVPGKTCWMERLGTVNSWALLSVHVLYLGQRLLLVQTTHPLPQRIFANLTVLRNQDEAEKATLPDPKATFPDQKATFADHVLAIL